MAVKTMHPVPAKRGPALPPKHIDGRGAQVTCSSLYSTTFLLKEREKREKYSPVFKIWRTQNTRLGRLLTVYIPHTSLIAVPYFFSFPVTS